MTIAQPKKNSTPIDEINEEIAGDDLKIDKELIQENQTNWTEFDFDEEQLGLDDSSDPWEN